MSEYPPLPPPVDKTRPPAFHDLNESPKRFERMVMTLMAADPRFVDVDLFGIGGESQYGVDAIGRLAIGGSQAVQSAKCHEEVTPAILTGWIDEFLEHWDSYWRNRGVACFILAAAPPKITALKVHERIEVERRRLADKGISLEVWGPEALIRRLGDNQPATLRFLGMTWANILHGPAPRDHAATLSPVLVQALNQAQASVSELVVARLADGLDHLRAEDFDKVEAVLDLARGRAWGQLTDPVKAAVLRLAGDLAHTRDDYDPAEAYSQAALALDPTETRLKASLAVRSQGVASALDILGRPRDHRGRQLQTSLLLGVGRAHEAQTVIRSLLAERPDDPESARLATCVQFALSDPKAALDAAARAEHLAPAWPRIIAVAAQARYIASFSPATPIQILLDGSAVPWVMVKTDDASLDLRRAALEGYSRLSGRSGRDREVEIGHLACLACHPDAQDEAAAFARALLQKRPDDETVLDWALLRKFPFDPEPSKAALRCLLDDGAASAGQVALLAILLGEASQSDAISVMRSVPDGLAMDAKATAAHWAERLEAQASGAMMVSAAPDVNAAVAAAAIDDYGALRVKLREGLDGDRPTLGGFNLAVTATHRGWWSALVPHVDALVRFETAQGIGLAAVVLHHTASPEALLDFVEKHRVNRTGDIWPAELRRLEVKALARLRRWPGALQQARALVAEFDEVEDWRMLAHLLGSVGDTKACLPLVRRLLKDKALLADEALRYATTFAREDRTFARDLWREAVRLGVPDVLAMTALGQAFKLGLDKETAPLHRLLQARAQSETGDVWTASAKDLPEILRQGREHADHVSDLLLGGAVPVHMAAAALGEPLARFLRFDATEWSRPPSRPVPIRHGARGAGLRPKEPWANWCLFMDSTALLVAQDLDLLDLVEGLEQPILVGRNIINALYTLENDVTHQQLARIEAGEAILAARQSGKLGLAAAAREDETVRHDRDRGLISQPGPTVNSLRQTLEEAKAIAPTTKLSKWAPLSTAPRMRQRLMFADNTLRTAVLDYGLDPLLRNFTCEIAEAELVCIQQDVATARAGDSLADRLKTLRERVAAGLQKGRYEHPDTAPELDPDVEIVDDGIAEHDFSPVEASYLELVGAAAAPNGMVWVDDRYTGGHPQTNGNRVIGAPEVLNALVAAELITPDARRAKLLKLREGGAVFLAMSLDELVRPLLAAPIDDKTGLVETPALETLRRNFAVALRLDPFLKIGETDYETLRDQPDEFAFLNNARRLTIDTLDQIWRRPVADIDDCRARADWVWSAMRVERCVRAFPGDDVGLGNQMFAALLVSGCVALAANWSIAKSFKATEARQAEYLAWLNETVLAPRLGLDGPFLDLVAAQLRELLAIPFEKPLKDSFRKVVIRLRQDVVQRLPDELRLKVIAEDGFCALIGASTWITLNFGGHAFDNSEFWRACTRALRQGSAYVRDRNGVRLRLERKDEDLMLQSASPARLSDPLFAILPLPPARRRAAALVRLETLDLVLADLEAYRNRIHDARDEGDLAYLFDEAEALNVNRYYDAMVTTYDAGEGSNPLSLFLPPRADRLLHALRLGPADRPFPDRVAAAWSRLAQEASELDAFVDLAGLPVDLADLLHKRQVDVSTLGPACTPVARLHLAALMQRRGEDPIPALEALSETVRGEAWLFVTLLIWSLKAFQNDPTWWGLATEDQLALVWTHAHRLTAMIAPRTSGLRETAMTFLDHQPPRVLGAILAEPRVLATDRAYPHTLHPAALICHGLAYVFGQSAVFETFSEGLARNLLAMFTEIDEASVKTSTAFLTQSDQQGDGLGGWLSEWPMGILNGELVSEDHRTRQLEQLVAEIEADPCDPAAWICLSYFGRPLLPPALRDRLDAVFESLALWSFHDKGGEGLGAIIHVVGARLGLGGPISQEVLLGKFHALAAAAAAAYPGEIRRGDADGEGAAAERGAVFQAIANALGEVAKRETPAEALEAFHDAAMTLAHAWPAAAPALRDILDRFVRTSRPSEMGAVWRAFVALRQWA